MKCWKLQVIQRIFLLKIPPDLLWGTYLSSDQPLPLLENTTSFTRIRYLGGWVGPHSFIHSSNSTRVWVPVICRLLCGAQWLWQELWRLHRLLSCSLWSRGEDTCSSHKHTGSVCAQIVVKSLEGRKQDIWYRGDSVWMDERIWKGLFWEIGFKLWPAQVEGVSLVGCRVPWRWRVHGAGRWGGGRCSAFRPAEPASR